MERQTVYNIIESISTTSTEIFADFSMIRFNPGLQNSFDKTVAWIITADTKNKYTKKQTTANIGAFELKNGIFETEVYLRFHTNSEYDRLSGAQIAELHNWRQYSAGKRSATGDPEGGGRGHYGRRVGRGGRGRGRGGRGRGIGQGRGNFESQVSAIIAKNCRK